MSQAKLQNTGHYNLSKGFDVEARGVLRKLSEPRAVLAVAEGMEKAVIIVDQSGAASADKTVVLQDLAQALALRGWIGCDAPGRVSRYRITSAGRAALSQLMAAGESKARGLHEGQTRFLGVVKTTDDAEKARYSLTESPLVALARRRDKDGQPFLTAALLTAGERLREDFELSQVGASQDDTVDWDAVVAGLANVSANPAEPNAAGARQRVAAALSELGPGLGDVALRCCCMLDGLEKTERRMGWSARSGKIVLRIALQRLKRHYDEAGVREVLIG